MKLINLDQKSLDWHVWRNCGIGSSDAAAICGLSKWKNILALWKTKSEALHAQIVAAETPMNGAMVRGHLKEPIARRLYEEFMGFEVPAVCCVHDDYPFLKASLDGWNAARRLAVEIKAPNADDHQSALDGIVPLHYSPQVDHLLLVTGAVLLHYVSYSDYFPPTKQFKIVPVYRDETKLKMLLNAELEFWHCVLNNVLPPLEGPEIAPEKKVRKPRKARKAIK